MQEERERVTLLAGQRRGGSDQPGDVGIQAGLLVIVGVPVGVGALVLLGVWPGACWAWLVRDGRLGGPAGSSSPVRVFMVLLVPWHDLKLRFCWRTANQHALSQAALNGARHHWASLNSTGLH